MSRCKLSEVPAAIEEWKSHVKDFCFRSPDVDFSERLRVAFFFQMVPQDLAKELKLKHNTSKAPNYRGSI